MRMDACLAVLGVLLSAIPAIAQSNNPLLPQPGQTLNYRVQLWRLDHNPLWNTGAPVCWHLLSDAEMQYLGEQRNVSVTHTQSTQSAYPLDNTVLAIFKAFTSTLAFSPQARVPAATLIPTPVYSTLPPVARTVLQQVTIPAGTYNMPLTTSEPGNAGGYNYQQIEQSGSGTDTRVQLSGSGNMVSVMSGSGSPVTFNAPASGGTVNISLAPRLFVQRSPVITTVTPPALSVKTTPCTVYLWGQQYAATRATTAQRDPQHPGMLLTEEDTFIGTMLYKRCQTTSSPPTPQSPQAPVSKRVCTLL